jgi:hypothetical protein
MLAIMPQLTDSHGVTVHPASPNQSDTFARRTPPLQAASGASSTSLARQPSTAPSSYPYRTRSKHGGVSQSLDGANECDNNKKRGASDDSLGRARPAKKRVKTKGKEKAREGKEKEDDRSVASDDSLGRAGPTKKRVNTKGKEKAREGKEKQDKEDDRSVASNTKRKGKAPEGKEKEGDRNVGDDDEEDAMLWSHFDDSDWDWSTIFQYWP